jgi:hypothetical protein
VAVAEAREDRVERYEPLRTSVKEETPAERMGEQSDTKVLQGTVGVRRSLKREKEEEREEEEREEEEREEEEREEEEREEEEREEEEREEGEKQEEAEEEEERLYPSLLRRDIANNDRQNNLVKSGKRGKRETGSKKRW